MKIVVLSTETPHHAKFVDAINSAFSIELTILETKMYRQTFDTWHSFETEREQYEWDYFYGGATKTIKEFTRTLETPNINSSTALNELQKIKPNVIVTFGTRIIRPPLIEIAPQGIINLHGGPPERYRGLDTHLWALYHQDLHGLTTTLHRLNSILDDGDIIGEKALPLASIENLIQLRAINTEVCIELTLDALNAFQKSGEFSSRPQRKRGRYYSAMPAVLKDVIYNTFSNRQKRMLAT